MAQESERQQIVHLSLQDLPPYVRGRLFDSLDYTSSPTPLTSSESESESESDVSQVIRWVLVGVLLYTTWRVFSYHWSALHAQLPDPPSHYTSLPSTTIPVTPYFLPVDALLMYVVFALAACLLWFSYRSTSLRERFSFQPGLYLYPTHLVKVTFRDVHMLPLQRVKQIQFAFLMF